MKSITEKYTAKNFSIGISHNHAPQSEKKSKKQYAMHFTDSAVNNLGPELLEAHIIALLGNALS